MEVRRRSAMRGLSPKAAPSHKRSVTAFPGQPLKRPFHSKTCRMAYEHYSAGAVVDDLAVPLQSELEFSSN
jgi:hypothetical protein